MVQGAQLLEVGRLIPIRFRVSAMVVSHIQTLLHLLVQMKNRETQIVPQFRVASESIGRFFEIFKGLQILLFFVQSEAEIVKNFSSSL